MERLLKTTEQYRVNDEDKAYAFVENIKNNQAGFTLTKHAITLKVKKSKGEIIDSYYIVNIEKVFNEETI